MLSKAIVSDGSRVQLVAVHCAVRIMWQLRKQGRVSIVTHYYNSLGPLSQDGPHHVVILRH